MVNKIADAELAGLRKDKDYDGRCPKCKTRTGKSRWIGDWTGTGSDKHRVEVRICNHCKYGERAESYPWLLSNFF